jgi:hypothetical protein
VEVTCPLDTKLPSERLSHLIHQYGLEALEARQVAKRLGDLLMQRLQDLKREHARRLPGSPAERAALTDSRYLAFVDEYCNVAHQSLFNRVQYDTHLMLLKARQSLRRLPPRKSSV